MEGSSDSQYVTALASIGEHASTCSSPFISASCESMLERTESGQGSSTEEQIEHSKSHWSHLAESGSGEEEVAEVSNVEVFKTLEMHPTWGTFFRRFNEGEGDVGELVVGEKFAEGGQAELYEAQVTWRNPRRQEEDLRDGLSWVLKVFKKGTFLRHLQSQWPHGYLKFHAELVEHTERNTQSQLGYRQHCDVHCGTLLKDGRFAFLLEREHGNLRSLIDQIMSTTRHDHGPFAKDEAEWIMYDIARGMDWLHSRSIVQRDLKASNVLVHKIDDEPYFDCYVADFECSIGVVGTGFFRAPEILQACKDKTASQRPELFTKMTDVYSYGMTCYEILTGKLPFEGHPVWDFGDVLGGQRPEVLNYVDDWVRELLSRCWQSDPIDRPSFEGVLNLFHANSAVARDFELTLQQWKTSKT